MDIAPIQLQVINGDVRLSYSSLSAFRKSPEHWIEYKTCPTPDSDASIFGNAFHCWVLRPNDFNNEFVIYDDTQRPIPDKNYQTKINREWRQQIYDEALSKGKKVIEMDEFDKIKLMHEKLMSNEPASELLNYTRSEYEKSITFERKGLKILSILDIKADVFLADLKTTNDADPIRFHRDIYNYGYDLQPAVYNDAAAFGHARFEKLKEFYFIAIEKSPPFGISVNKFSGDALQQSFEDYLNLLDHFNKCLEDPELFLRSYDFYCNDQLNKVFEVHKPYWK